ncbi:uncharacterized protein LOC126796302 [Argentina anserina]|uniref:uncharacterized protein LOC126796302 n=1 Tax=Argentina anserina TaxID=57926 RepID=UPI0021765A88|nr:uncharacterized protein LOC126796302 [Potentilla anserina]
MEEDEMDSLFEGMVLFDPNSSQLDSDSHPPPLPPQDTAEDRKIESQDAPPSPPGSSSEPLDENLFSDLTVQFQSPPVEQQDPIKSTSRQNSSSRKKKRAAGLRIGYARHSSNSHDRSLSIDADDVITDGIDSLPEPSPSTPSLPPVQPELRPEAEAELQSDEFEVTPEVRLEQSKAVIGEKLRRARELAASVSSARKDSIARRRAAADDLNVASVDYGSLEKQLEEACEAEDFETAERLSDSLAAAQEKRQVLLAALRDAEADCDAVDSKMHEVLQSQIAAEEECASLLQQFATDASNNADLVLKAAEELSSTETDKWLSSTEALEAKKMELEFESHIIGEAGLGLNSCIETSVEDDKKEKESLCKKRDILTDELEKLLALVREKEQEIAQNDRDIRQVEEKIANVLSGFGEMQSTMEAKSSDLQEALSQIHLENEALSTQKTEIDAVLTQDQERGAKLRELARVSAEEAEGYQQVAALRKSLMSSILKSREDKVRLAKTEEKLSEDVQKLQQDVSAARTSLQERSSRKSSIQQDIASSKQKIIFIDKRIPELEAEKKVAATARNFKEAARIAAEAKSLNVEKDGLQIDMQKAISELDKLEEEIKETVNRLQETEGHILSKEKEVATARFQRLLLVSGIAKAEREAALDLGDIEEANLLLAEAEAADSEAKELEPVYNFKLEEVESLPKHFMSVVLISTLGKKQLEELAASVQVSPA